MANRHETLTSLFSDIADAIRAKSGEAVPLTADEFDTAIGGIDLCNVSADSVTSISPSEIVVQVESAVDSAASQELAFSLGETDCLPQNIVSGRTVLGVTGTAKKVTVTSGTVQSSGSVNLDFPAITALPRALVVKADSFEAARAYATADEKPVYIAAAAPVSDPAISFTSVALNCIDSTTSTAAMVRIAGSVLMISGKLRLSTGGTSAKFEPGVYHWTAYDWED